MPATTLVLPTFRECPPTTTTAIIILFAPGGPSAASSFKYPRTGRAGSSPESNSLPPQNFVGENTALSAKHYAFFDAGLLADAHLSPDYHVFFDDDASGESGLGGDDHIFPDPHVVADVNQVVDLRRRGQCE